MTLLKFENKKQIGSERKRVEIFFDCALKYKINKR